MTGAFGPSPADIGLPPAGNDSAYCMTGAFGPSPADIGPPPAGNDSAYCSRS
jgi:hypothetical protein